MAEQAMRELLAEGPIVLIRDKDNPQGSEIPRSDTEELLKRFNRGDQGALHDHEWRGHTGERGWNTQRGISWVTTKAGTRCQQDGITTEGSSVLAAGRAVASHGTVWYIWQSC